MFHSATLKLTGWYLLILMSISIIFSFTIYNVATGELKNRLDDFQSSLSQPGMNSSFGHNPRLFSAFRQDQRSAVEHNLFITLVYVNILILLGGGVLSYLLARRTLRQIEDSHDAQSRFTSDVSHELRTPLAAMKAELEVALRDKKLSKGDMRELLESNLEEVDKLTTLSKTLLQFSKLDHASLDKEVIDLSVTASEIVQRYDKNMSRISITVPSRAITITANKSSVEELLTILVDNALKYSSPDSKIYARVGQENKRALFEITNSGRGISPDDLPHIFDRFYRADPSRTTSGTGLGLSLAKKIVEMLEGELSVSSAIDNDTTFRVLLPLSKTVPRSSKQNKLRM
jgi:signal transduction histidine kinase